jgi:hypothetical protein
MISEGFVGVKYVRSDGVTEVSQTVEIGADFT